MSSRKKNVLERARALTTFILASASPVYLRYRISLSLEIAVSFKVMNSFERIDPQRFTNEVPKQNVRVESWWHNMEESTPSGEVGAI